MTHLSAQTDRPYPAPQVAAADPVAGRAMLDNVGSANSEMTAVSLYFYNSVIARPEDLLLSQTFHSVMLVEMRHLELFARLALLLGMDPRLWAQQRRRMVYWTPRAIRYPVEREALLENALRGELAAIEQYQRQREVIADPHIRAALARVIEDEQLHVDLFAALLEGKDPATVLRPPKQPREGESGQL